MDEAERLHRESLAIRKEIGYREGEAVSLNNLGNIAKTQGDLDEAERLYQESLEIKREIGYRQGEANSLNNLGEIATARGDMEEAERLYQESFVINKEIGNQQGMADSLSCIIPLSGLSEVSAKVRESVLVFEKVAREKTMDDFILNLQARVEEFGDATALQSEIAEIINPGPEEKKSRAGQRWDNEEDDHFLSLLETGKSLEEIAFRFKRSEGAIRSRISWYYDKGMIQISNLGLSQDSPDITPHQIDNVED